MQGRLQAVALKIWPGLANTNTLERAVLTSEIITLLYSAPLMLISLVWLAAVTDLTLLSTQWATLLLFLALIVALERLSFFLVLEVEGGASATAGDSLSFIIIWSTALIFGPIALWLNVLWSTVSFISGWRDKTSVEERINHLRDFMLPVSSITLSSLIALNLYQAWGGTFPLTAFTSDLVLLAIFAILIQFLVNLLLWLPFITLIRTQTTMMASGILSLKTILQLFAVGLVLPEIAAPFGILLAVLYTQNGLGAFLFAVVGILLASLLAHRLSRAAEYSQQRSRELAKLEQLGRAIIEAPPDASTLPDLLRQHIPGMFLNSLIEIRFYPDQIMLQHPEFLPPVDSRLWQWLFATSEPHVNLPKAIQPWDNKTTRYAHLTVPIVDADSLEPIGGICVRRSRDPQIIGQILPAVQTLADQIISALKSAEVYQQTLDLQKIEQELKLAGQIQTSFLPNTQPQISGWQLSARLDAARQTSGDFFDFIPLPENRLGIVIADVADKGTGAALYMALSRTLIRTYAFEYEMEPDLALTAANRRILDDTRSDLFVTVFYGILDPASGMFIYCNAGHNPPFLLRGSNGKSPQALRSTGIPLGMFEDFNWKRVSIQIDPGDVLLLYTDGVTEAQDTKNELFGEERLIEIAKNNPGHTADALRRSVIAGINNFVGDAPQADDITLIILKRDT